MMRRIERTKAYGVTLLATLSLLSVQCDVGKGTRSADRLPDQVICRFRVEETRGGRPLFLLVAEKATVYDDGLRIEVSAPQVTFLDEGRRPYSLMTADSGTIFRNTEELVVRGSVHIETSESTRLITDSLTWSNRLRRLHTDAVVVLQTRHGRIEGQGLVSDPSLERVEIKSEVIGHTNYEFESRQ
ncbi:MAG: LPS export ABC transporter periplasmic protein LptC [candidate division WOR-3 bacterium]